MSKKKQEETPKFQVEQYIFIHRRPYLDPVVELVENEKEMLNIPWVKSTARTWKCNKYTISTEENEFPGAKILMLENEDCTFWWPVAIIENEFPTTLPQFTRELVRKDMVETKVSTEPKKTKKQKKDEG